MNLADTDTLRVILLAVAIFFTLGSAAGWLLAQLLKPSDEAEKQTTEEGAQSEPISLPSPPSSDPDKIELARLYRDRFTRDVFLLIDGRQIDSTADLNDTQRAWLRAAEKKLAELQAAPQSETTGAQPVTDISPASWLSLPPPTRPDRAAPAAEPNLQKPSLNPLDALLRRTKSGPTKSTLPLSLAGQIDEILQELLIHSPFAGREIRLGENESLGLEVWVGASRYDGIDAVPDAQVRDLIRAAVAEWQARSRS